MKSKRKQNSTLFGSVVSEMEAQLDSLTSRPLRILEDDGGLVGVCFLSKNLSYKKRTALEDRLQGCKEIRIEGISSNKSDSPKIALLPKRVEEGNTLYLTALTEMFQRALVSRIPFANLLLQFSTDLWSVDRVEVLIKTIQKGMKPDDILSPVQAKMSDTSQQHHRFSLLLQSSGLSKARRKAEEIQSIACQCLFGPAAGRGNPTGQRNGLNIGLGVSCAGDHQSVEGFLETVEKSLAEAILSGENICWQHNIKSGSSCQVTAEERAQLFGFLK